MLYWIWFVILSVAGILLVHLQSRDSETENGIGVWLMILSLVVSWPRIVSPVYDFFDSNLPNTGEIIHDATAVILVAILCILWVVMPFGLTELLQASQKKGKKVPAHE